MSDSAKDVIAAIATTPAGLQQSAAAGLKLDQHRGLPRIARKRTPKAAGG